MTMQTLETIDGVLFADMMMAGTANLQNHVKAINELNVFPIPDGDTGDNMLMTMLGGVQALEARPADLSRAAQDAANGMMLSARGNSGVILSQFFGGLAEGLAGVRAADSRQIGSALRQGVRKAYDAVVDPQEGTILTVARCATEYACQSESGSLSEFFANFVEEAARTLKKTPDMLPVLKKAGVVDSGGAGLLFIMQGVRQVIDNKKPDTEILKTYIPAAQEIDIDRFTEDSVLEFGYCTELLLRLQRRKTDIDHFRIERLSERLQAVGESVVAFKNGSIVKIHVHSMTPDRVLAICQEYGEFLKVKIENMSLQHNNTLTGSADTEVSLSAAPPAQRKQFGIIAVASGEGIRQSFLDRGADAVIDGGSSMNPSVEDFLSAFSEVNADIMYVLPNNSNAILAARQAASIYTEGQVFVLESRTVGDGYAAITMFDTTCGDADDIFEQMREAMEGVVTAAVARSCRAVETADLTVRAGDYFGFVGKDILSAGEDRPAVVCRLIEALDFSRFDICIIIYGCQATLEEARTVETYIGENHGGTEVFLIDGKQDVHDYILILE